MATEPLIRPRSVYELIEQKLGVTIDFRFGELTSVGTASAEAARNDPGRVALLMVNLSSNTITVRPVHDATTAQGIRLTANGGCFTANWQDDLILPALRWSAISSGSSSSVFVLEAVIT